jgi:hypothetical protein
VQFVALITIGKQCVVYVCVWMWIELDLAGAVSELGVNMSDES